MSFLQRREKPASKERIVRDAAPVARKGRGANQSPPAVVSAGSSVVYKEIPLPKPGREAVRVDEVTAVIVNFKTLWLTRAAYRSLANFYVLPILVVDNGSGDAQTTEWVKSVGGICNGGNLGHGPALHQAIQRVKTRYVLTLDSDCVVKKGKWLEQMQDAGVYAIGWLRYVDKFTGVPLEWHLNTPPGDRFIPYVHPAVGLYEVETYRELRPFFNHGAPALWNMLDANNRFPVKDFPVFDYVEHLVAGTRRMYGGRWDPTSSEPTGKWEKGRTFPI